MHAQSSVSNSPLPAFVQNSSSFSTVRDSASTSTTHHNSCWLGNKCFSVGLLNARSHVTKLPFFKPWCLASQSISSVLQRPRGYDMFRSDRNSRCGVLIGVSQDIPFYQLSIPSSPPQVCVAKLLTSPYSFVFICLPLVLSPTCIVSHLYLYSFVSH